MRTGRLEPMRLFEPFAALVAAPASPPRIETPHGGFDLVVLVDGEPLPVVGTLVVGVGVELRRYEHPLVAVELLTLPYVPRLPERMRLDRSVAGVWRARATAPTPPISFRAVAAADWKAGDGDVESGEGLMALTWYAPDGRVSLGTSDEGDLVSASKVGLLPERLAYAYAVDHEIWPRALEDNLGLETSLPPLLAGETAQTHIAAAWQSRPEERNDVSTWLAVDVFAREMAWQADAAVGRSA